MLRKRKWQIPGEPLAARYNWCQGPVPGRDSAVEKHYSTPSLLKSLTLTTLRGEQEKEGNVQKEERKEEWKKKAIEMTEQRKKAEEGVNVAQYYAGIRSSFLSKHTALLSAINCRG